MGDGESIEKKRLASTCVEDSESDFDENRNVIRLSTFRRPAAPEARSTGTTRQSEAKKSLVFYISESARWLEMLQSMENLELVDIRSTKCLQEKLMGRTPELVLLESAFQWACPFETIDRLDYLLEVPIVLICDREGHAPSPELIKKAFAAGVHDTLFTPLKKDELSETLEVLLKLQRHSLRQ